LLSITHASYYSIKRLVLENLFSLNSVTLINANGIIPNGLIMEALKVLLINCTRCSPIYDILLVGIFMNLEDISSLRRFKP